MSKNKISLKNKSKLQKGLMLGFAGIFAAIGAYFILSSKAATVGPNLGFYMTSSNNTPNVGSQFDVTLYANTGTTPVKSIAALVNFDPTQVTENIASAAPQADPLATPPVSGFDVTFACGPANGCRTDNGKVAFGLTNTGTARRSGDTQLIGTIRFTALKAGPINITYDPSNTLTGFLNPDGTTQATLDTRAIQNPTLSANDVTPPSVPTGLASPSKTVTSVTLTWNPSTDDAAGTGLNGYKIYRGGTQVGTTNATTTTYTDSGLTPNTAYSYTVAAYDKATPTNNTSAQTAALPVTTPADTVAPSIPGKPTAGTTTFSSIVVNWTASTDNVAVAGYKIFRDGTQVGTSATTTYTDTGLLPSHSYTYTVSAYDGALPTPNNSVQSASTAISTTLDTQAPTAPTLQTPTTPTTTSVGLSWTASTDNDAVSLYRILQNGTQVKTTNSPATSDTITGLAPGLYTFSIVAVDRSGNPSAPSASQSVRIYSPKDLNRDGIIGIGDFSLVLANYGLPAGSGLAGDANGDNVTNINDITTLLAVWGTAG